MQQSKSPAKQAAAASIPAGRLHLKRAYDAPEKEDGIRILVDRLWPRGLKKEKAAIDLWPKDLAPSTELRKWFHAELGDERWPEFRERYRKELGERTDEADAVRQMLKKGPVTLVYGAKDEEHNHALVLRDFLIGKAKTAK